MDFDKFFKKHFKINAFYKYPKIKFDCVTRVNPNGEKAKDKMATLVKDLDRLIKAYGLERYVEQNGIAALADKLDELVV